VADGCEDDDGRKKGGASVLSLALTRRQQECLRFIGDVWMTSEQMPTHREICVGLGIRSHTAQHLVRPLVSKGALIIGPARRARGMRVSDQGWAVYWRLIEQVGEVSEASLSRSDSEVHHHAAVA
jgi:SOS-response transcriptional repressor LexA